MCKELFQELTVNAAKELYRYEATKFGKEVMARNQGNGQYAIERPTLVSQNRDGNQVPWCLEWMRKYEGTMKIYRDSLRELRVDSTYCPCPKRYSWDDFARVQARFPLALNYPKLPSPEHYTEMTEEWMIQVCSEQLQLYSRLPYYTIKMFKKF